MFKRIELISIMAAVAVALTACQQQPAEPPANDIAAIDNAALTNVAEQDANAQTPAPGGAVCGTMAGLQCSGEGEFCKQPMGQCEVADAAGKCTVKPDICTKEIREVCGCDGKTYSNPCMADQAGVNVQSDGACKPQG